MSTVAVEPCRQGWRVVVRNGDRVTTVGTHTAKYKANEQAAKLRGEA